MVIEIWSDIMCPFCYIGKNNFEHACQQVDFANDLRVVYKSYQLDPGFKQRPGETISTYLQRSKRMSAEQIKNMTDGVVAMGKEAGLTINFETNIPANTFLPHQIIHFAHAHRKAKEMINILFKAHFELGLDIQIPDVLIELTQQINLPKEEVVQALASGSYAAQVENDIKQAREINVQGVPFFLFNSSYAISGAQPVESFVEVLKTSYAAFKNEKREITMVNDSAKNLGCDDQGCQV